MITSMLQLCELTTDLKLVHRESRSCLSGVPTHLEKLPLFPLPTHKTIGVNTCPSAFKTRAVSTRVDAGRRAREGERGRAHLLGPADARARAKRMKRGGRIVRRRVGPESIGQTPFLWWRGRVGRANSSGYLNRVMYQAYLPFCLLQPAKWFCLSIFWDLHMLMSVMLSWAGTVHAHDY